MNDIGRIIVIAVKYIAFVKDMKMSISSMFSSNSEASASELLDNIEEIVTDNYINTRLQRVNLLDISELTFFIKEC